MKRTPHTRQSTQISLTGIGSTWRFPPNAKEGLGQGYRAKSLVLDSALEEYRRLRGEGKPIDRDEFCAKFPDYRKSLLRLIDVAENLGDLGDISDPFPEAGGEFLGFEILDRIGVGAIARVYLASEPELGGRTVVIKVATEGTAEAAILGKLQHPNIVQVYSVKKDEATGMTAVCMPYQGSATLTDVLDLAFQAGKPPEMASAILEVGNRLADLNALRDDDLMEHRPDAVLLSGTFVDGVVHLGIQLAEALNYAHSCGVLHRDLKPSNVLLTPYGRPMLLDFNLSFDASRDAVPRGGTLPYMAPEQIRASIRGDMEGVADPRSDAFSLGVICYELLTGKLPYGGPPDSIGPQAASLWQLNAHETPPQPLQELIPSVPAEVAAVVHRCLATAPTARFENLAEVSAALRQHFTRARRLRRWMQHHTLLCWLIVAATFLPIAGTAAYFALRPPFADRQYAAALVAHGRGENARSVELLNSALARTPDHLRAKLLRGVCLYDLGLGKDAEVDLLSVAATAPSAAVYDYLGCIAFRSSRLPEAAQYFEQAIQLEPDQATLKLKYAYLLHLSKNRSDTALESINRAIKQDEDNAAAYFVRGMCLQDNNLKDAMRDYSVANKLAADPIAMRLAVARQLEHLVPNKPETKPTLRAVLTELVDLGVSKDTINSLASRRLFRSDPEWWNNLVSKAREGKATDSKESLELVVPSISVELQL